MSAASTPTPLMLAAATRYFETVRHLTARQIVARIELRAAVRVRRLWPAAANRLYRGRVARADLVWRRDLLALCRSARDVRDALDEPAKRAVVGAAHDVGQGRFQFLNERGELGVPPDWSAPSKSQLWRYHLHYFDALIDLVIGSDHPWPAARELIEGWIATNSVDGTRATGDAWHPYVVSLRMVNWMLALSAIGAASDVPVSVRHSLAEHALFLERNLETDVGGNHLLKNLKAMVFAGCFWDGTQAGRWRQQFTGRFVQELDRQLLSDGGHYERSPLYHSQVLCDAIEVAALLVSRRDELAAPLLRLVNRMDRFLTEVTHPDGEIALFNDSAFGMTPAPALLHRAVAALSGEQTGLTTPRLALLIGSEVRPKVEEPVTGLGEGSGYVAVPGGNSTRFLLADVGAVCPDDLPAHAHADLLSFELSLDGRRMIVDSGVGEYAAGPWRDYYRSTRAHNTVVVDGTEQSDCWGSFRVGRRAAPANVVLQRDEQTVVLEAEHTGYDHLQAGARHRRRFTWTNDGFWLIADSLIGGGQHSWSSLCHFHPEVEVADQGPSWIRLVRDRSVLDLCWYGFGGASIVRGQSDPIQGWYADHFGPAAPAAVLVLDGSGPLPARFGYAMVPQPSRSAAPAAVMLQDTGVEICVGGRTRQLPLASQSKSVAAT